MIIRTLAYVCDKCNKSVTMLRADQIADLPLNWQVEKPSYSYGNNVEKHICDKCIEKKEIKETFK